MKCSPHLSYLVPLRPKYSHQHPIIYLLLHMFLYNTAWVAYRALTTPLGRQPYAETCRGRILNVLIKIHYFLGHLLVFFINDGFHSSVGS
jgi:hypothetical protein